MHISTGIHYFKLLVHIQVLHQPYSSKAAQFYVMPKYKVREEGEKVSVNKQCDGNECVEDLTLYMQCRINAHAPIRFLFFSRLKNL